MTVKVFYDSCGFVSSLAGYPPFSPDRRDKPMPQQILTGDYQHYMREKFWDDISDNGGYLHSVYFLCNRSFKHKEIFNCYRHDRPKLD